MKNIAIITFSVFALGCHGFQTKEPTPISENAKETSKSPTVNLDPATMAFIQKNVSGYVGDGVIQETGDKKFPSLVLAVVTPKGNAILGFGTTSKKVAPTGKDIYPVSSITKMMTGLIMARGVAENSFFVPTKLSELLPPDLAPLVGNRTLGLVASHYASYKAKPLNLDYTNVNAPAATYSKANLITCLKSENCSVTAYPLGTDYLYSDLGIGLLGLALMNYYKAETYEDLLTARLTKDLDMTSTSANLNKYTAADNIIEGSKQNGEAVKPATMGVLAAAGAVLSNGEDMLKLLKEILNPGAQWKKTMEIATTPIQPGIGFAIDINTIDSMKLYSKSGEQAGYSSLIMWNYKTNSGIVALGNRGLASKSLAKFLIKIHKQMGEVP